MPAVAIETIRGVHSASGIDSGVVDWLATLPLHVVPEGIDALIQSAHALPGGVGGYRRGPRSGHFYITAKTNAGRAQTLWPKPGQGERARLASSSVEGSLYYIAHRVDESQLEEIYA